MATAASGSTRGEKDEAALALIEDLTSNCDKVQRKVLAEILSQNGETEYLKRHGMNGCTNSKTFTSRVPVITYEDIEPDIKRIANGDFSPILCSHPIIEFVTSSGTSGGECKMMPSIAEEMDRKKLLYSLVMPVMNQYMPGLDNGKALNFLFTRSETRTPGGLPARPVLTSYYKSHQFKNRPYDPHDVCTSPIEAILCPDSFQSMYTQMLCGLYDRHAVLRIGAVFASGLLWAIRFLQLHYRDLCHDIATGSLSPKITDSGLRACMTKTMRPEPELSELIMEICKGENWEGIIKKIWPNTKYLEVILTGAMVQHIPTLDYYSGGLPKVSTLYGSSECFSGLNLKPLCEPCDVSYTILPNMGYFEFIPLDDGSLSIVDRGSNPRLVNLADVEVGKEYELVVTNYAGLYRYRVEDVLRVTGFYNSTPQFKFIRRKNVLLSIDADKTDESELQKATEHASELLKPYSITIAEYTSYVDTKSIPGHYVIYWEFLTNGVNGPSPEVLGHCCLAMEGALNSVYRSCRVADGIGPLEIRVVENGAFEALMDYAISRGASITQYKVPRCVKDTNILELLDSKVVSTHFSSAKPHSG